MNYFLAIQLWIHNSSCYKYTTLLVVAFLFLTTPAAATQIETNKVNNSLETKTVGEVLKDIEGQTEYNFFLNNKKIDLARKVEVKANHTDVFKTLNDIFKNTDVTYSVVDKTIILTNTQQLSKSGAASVVIRGTVVDETNEPVIGASVIEKGTKNGVITDIDGNFELKVSKHDAVLDVSYIGYNTTSVKVKSDKPIRIVLKEDNVALDEVVVVGYGTQKKVNLTGSVSQVNEKTFESRPVQNITQALQGVVPGMNMSVGANGGKLNNSPSISIRGAGTIGSGSTASPLILIDGVEGNLNLLNPQDIESVSVLKDAAASSIYGSRAPFGVILITTKRGKEGKPMISYVNNFRFNSPINQPEMMDSYSFVNYFNDARRNAGQSPFFSQTTIDNIIARNNGEVGLIVPCDFSNNKFTNAQGNANTDWYKVHYKDWVMSQEHSVSASGGNKQLSYYLSGNFMDQEGLMRFAEESYNRYSINGKIMAQLNKHVNVSYNTKWFRTNYDSPSYLSGLFYHNMLRKWPNMSAVDPNGHYADNSEIIQLQDGGESKEELEQIFQQLKVEITPLKNWKIYLEGNYRSTTNFTHTDIQAINGHDIFGEPYQMAISNNYTVGQSRVTEKSTKNQFYSTNLYTDFFKEIKGHYIKAILGFNAELQKERTLTGSRDGIIVPGLPTLDTSSSLDKTSGGYNHWATAGFFGRINYNYQEKYMLEVNARYDGTSRFVRDKRWNVFPSFSLGWNVARENFWKPIEKYVNMFKFKASWGELGNQNTSSLYPFYETLPIGINSGNWLVNGDKTNTADSPALVSTLLTWERIQTLNIGVDFGAFSNRLTGTFELFKRKTLDMVGPAPQLPAILGIAVPKVNNADMQSAGFDFDISWRDRVGKVNYGVKFNLSDAKTKILRYPNTTNAISDWYAGKYSGEIWGYTTIGIARSQEQMDAHLATLPNGGQNKLGNKWSAGDIMYADINGDGKVDAGQSTLGDPGDRKIIGNSTPRYNFGLILDANWNGFDVSVFFQGVGKRDYAPGTGQQGAMFWGVVNNLYQSVALKPHLDYFRPEDDPMGANLDSYYPRPDLSTSKNQLAQTGYLQNAAYIRLKNIQIGYSLPKKWLSKIHLNKCRVYLSGDNLWTGTQLADMFDPETITGADGWGAGKTYPLSKIISFGVNINM